MARCGLFCLIVTTLQPVLAVKTLVDITGPGCDQLDGFYLKNIDDIISIYAYPQYNTIATRDHCDVVVRADDIRRIEYIIDNIIFNECGVEIRLYDNPTIDINPIRIVTCNDNSKVPIQGKTNYNVFRLRLRKTTTESRAFTFSMRLKNDLGPPMEFEKDAAKYLSEILEPGAIVGIALAGGILVFTGIGLAIFFCFRARSSNRKKEKYPVVDTTDGHKSNKFGVYPSDSPRLHRQHSPPTLSSHYEERSNQWGMQEYQAPHRKRGPGPESTLRSQRDSGRTRSQREPRRMRPPVPEPTLPSQRDPSRKGLSDRHRSGEQVTRPTNKRERESLEQVTRPTNKRERESLA